jgi:hypothetical protein
VLASKRIRHRKDVALFIDAAFNVVIADLLFGSPKTADFSEAQMARPADAATGPMNMLNGIKSERKTRGKAPGRLTSRADHYSIGIIVGSIYVAEMDGVAAL